MKELKLMANGMGFKTIIDWDIRTEEQRKDVIDAQGHAWQITFGLDDAATDSLKKLMMESPDGATLLYVPETNSFSCITEGLQTEPPPINDPQEQKAALARLGAALQRGTKNLLLVAKGGLQRVALDLETKTEEEQKNAISDQGELWQVVFDLDDAARESLEKLMMESPHESKLQYAPESNTFFRVTDDSQIDPVAIEKHPLFFPNGDDANAALSAMLVLEQKRDSEGLNTIPPAAS